MCFLTNELTATPDLFFDSHPKRSIKAIDGKNNSTTEFQRSKDGFIVKFVPVNNSQSATEENNHENDA